jgi:hypothetical protein
MVIVGMLGAAPSHSNVNPKDQTTSLPVPLSPDPSPRVWARNIDLQTALTVLAPVWAVTVVGPMVT